MKILDRLEELIVTIMLAAMTLLTFSQVVMRYVFNAGWTWALELTTVFFALMIFVGISYGVRVPPGWTACTGGRPRRPAARGRRGSRVSCS